MVNLDNSNETVFYIPFEGSDEEQPEIGPEKSELDALDGQKMRWDAYKTSWVKCLNRVQALVHTLYEPVVKEVVEKIEIAYDCDPEILSALPYPELPVIAVTNPSTDSLFLSSVISKLSDENQHIVAHLYPSDCSNISNAMKSIISGFTSISGAFKGSSRSLASYDIGVLESWYQAQDVPPSKLVLLLHDFEQFDPGVIQDVIHVCSLNVPRIPLIFLVSLSSSQSPSSYFHTAYPRSTLKQLQLKSVVVPGGPQVFEDIILKTFVDLSFDPDVVLGPATLEHLTEYAARFNHSVDALLNIFQLAHFKHFLLNPLTALVQSTPSAIALEDTASSTFCDILMTRLNDSMELDSDTENQNNTKTIPVLDMPKIIDGERNKFRSRVREMRLSYRLLRLIHEFLLARGYKGLGPHWGGSPSTLNATPLPTSTAYPRLQIFIDLLQRDSSENSQASKDIRYARILLAKLKPEELRAFLDDLIQYLLGLPDEVFDELDISDVVGVLGKWLEEADAAYTVDEDESNDVAVKKLAERLAKWISEYLRTLTNSLEEASPLWDVWYTGMAPFPSETVNPSVRASVLAGLLRPTEFTEANDVDGTGSKPNADEDDDSLWRLPDTSILFHRYLESGKMINVYDWFESFHAVLGLQRREEAKEKEKKSSPNTRKGRGKSTSPKKRRTALKSPVKLNSKGKAREVTQEDEDAAEGSKDDGFADDEKWKLVVQARFIRALHELDFLGFVKHTRRKPDHVLRTVFEVSE
ncbi:origin recognition complex subunit 3 N-terminus-domain-containing protein [Rhodocollybia butyracea]|uniref:Origin recognition complex subunit 3 N-terminus-domain-containing protein n=1 Tax=Rhodocollybia butyracea TaxID=206335 RepID=A0A9P5PSH5_9AGAR|nr:origin recognition complex subunit 3 N-terminus-domain-containing protein [Rhodocollybia butyracea]